MSVTGNHKMANPNLGPDDRGWFVFSYLKFHKSNFDYITNIVVIEKIHYGPSIFSIERFQRSCMLFLLDIHLLSFTTKQYSRNGWTFNWETHKYIHIARVKISHREILLYTSIVTLTKIFRFFQGMVEQLEGEQTYTILGNAFILPVVNYNQETSVSIWILK